MPQPPSKRRSSDVHHERNPKRSQPGKSHPTRAVRSGRSLQLAPRSQRPAPTTQRTAPSTQRRTNQPRGRHPTPAPRSQRPTDHARGRHPTPADSTPVPWDPRPDGPTPEPTPDAPPAMTTTSSAIRPAARTLRGPRLSQPVPAGPPPPSWSPTLDPLVLKDSCSVWAGNDPDLAIIRIHARKLLAR
jgi:hypothetical protein